jgi:hypothetical protein
MNKILIAGLAALALTTAIRQEAQAWSKFNFGVGFNIGWEGGGNSFLWGLARGQNVPGAYGQGDMGGGFGGYPGGYVPYPPPPGQGTDPQTGDKPEKVSPPTPIKPMGYYQQGYTPYPAYPTYSYPAYWGYSGW